LCQFKLFNNGILYKSAPNAFGINFANAVEQSFAAWYKKIC
jgi:hypothetical protein